MAEQVRLPGFSGKKAKAVAWRISGVKQEGAATPLKLGDEVVMIVSGKVIKAAFEVQKDESLLLRHTVRMVEVFAVDPDDIDLLKKYRDREADEFGDLADRAELDALPDELD